jgi:hypothetical protein
MLCLLFVVLSLPSTGVSAGAALISSAMVEQVMRRRWSGVGWLGVVGWGRGVGGSWGRVWVGGRFCGIR